MKKTKTVKLLMASLLMISTTGTVVADDDNNQTLKEKKEVTSSDTNTTFKNGEIIRGTTIGHYQKPGAPVDLSYAVTKINPGEIADVNITLTTPLKKGDMEVDINIDKDLEQIGDAYSTISFPLSEGQKEYKLNLKVKGKKDGLYYIRLLIKVDDGTGVKIRALAVPIYVGDGRLQRRSHQTIMKALEGENISVSKAKETIEIIK